MIERFEITNVHTTVDEKLQKYVIKKLGNLDHYLPRASRASAHAEVLLKEVRIKERSEFICAVTLHLPHEVLNVSETTPNIYSAVDIVEAKLKQRILKYKQTHATGALRRRLADRSLRKISA
ncbi:MAG TPA: ribosome-associated translation inhibitor RaiA [Candidatus Saccharimonadales bacterium]|jgi:ribosomal subunit interface protein